MRIRKHAKFSPLLHATSSLKTGTFLQTHFCQLNQSPWDVITFSPPSYPPPPPPFQMNGSDVRAGNGSYHCASVTERELSSRRRLLENPAAAEAPPPPPVESEATVPCCKTDGKSWHCRREAAKGNSLCEHHLSMSKNYNNVASKKPVKAAAAARPKKAPAASSSSSPYEFYYYSGFGPRWGKRRGETRKNRNGNTSMPKNAQMEPAVISRIGAEDFDFAEYEDDDEEEESKDNGKKRVRKPIKARSLKSLL